MIVIYLVYVITFYMFTPFFYYRAICSITKFSVQLFSMQFRSIDFVNTNKYKKYIFTADNKPKMKKKLIEKTKQKKICC